MFQKGNKLGKGKGPMPDDLKGCKLMNQRDVELLLNNHMDKSVSELLTFSKDPNNSVKEVLVARILIEAIRHGDQNRLEFVFNRLLGKPKEVVHHEHTVSRHNDIMDMIEEMEAEEIDVSPKRLKYEKKS